jgi:uncharacterized membrane protein YsdA (DUF1294 family)
MQEQKRGNRLLNLRFMIGHLTPMNHTRRPLGPVLAHSLCALFGVILLTVLLLTFLGRHGHWPWLLGSWLVAINAVTIGYYGFDKGCAGRGTGRVPELVLHGLSLLGGSPGAYFAMQTFRHKTNKVRFRVVYWSILALQIVLLGVLVWYGVLGKSSETAWQGSERS